MKIIIRASNMSVVSRARFESLTPFSLSRRADEVRTLVRLVISNAQPTRHHNERRREKRYPFPHPIHLTPIGDDGELNQDETLVVLGRNLSEMGLDFYHTVPVSYRRVIASLPCGEEKWIGLLLDLYWCRFNGYGWYENGGKFLSPAQSPLNSGVNAYLGENGSWRAGG